MSSNIVASIEKMNEYGYIVFDNIYRYVNANNMIKELFSEINHWHIDEKVISSESYLYKEVVEYLIKWNGQGYPSGLAGKNWKNYIVRIKQRLFLGHSTVSRVAFLLLYGIEIYSRGPKINGR